MEKTILLLDYDGTVHNTMAVYKPAFLKAVRELEELGWLRRREYSDDEIKYWIGFSAKEMWARFQPDFSREQGEYGSALVGKYMCGAVNDGTARLYPGAEAVLQELKKQYVLYFLSNCKDAYMEANRKRFGLDAYYERFYSSQQFGFIPKEEIFRKIREPGRKYIVVGDRAADLRLAKENGLPFVGCLYGFGSEEELLGADCLVRDITELPWGIRQCDPSLRK